MLYRLIGHAQNEAIYWKKSVSSVMAKIIGADGKKIYVVRYWLFEDG